MNRSPEQEERIESHPFICDIQDYCSPSSRIEGFQAIRELGLQGPRPLSVVTHRSFEEYKHAGMSERLQKSIIDMFNQILDENPQRGAYIGRAFYVPEIDNPNGPRTAAIYDGQQYLDEIERFWQFVIDQEYDIEGSDIALILHPFIHVMQPPRTHYGEIELAEDEVLPHSGGYAFPAPIPGMPNRVEIRAVFGADEAVQSCPHDVVFVDPDTDIVTEKDIAYKDKTFIPKTGSEYVLAEVPPRFRNVQALSDRELLNVASSMRGVENVRSEFLVQDDGIFFREIAPYDSSKEYQYCRLEPDEEITGPVTHIASKKDLANVTGREPIVYLGPSTFQERTTDIFSQLANLPDKNITALVYGTIQTSHMARILADSGHNVVLVGSQEFGNDEWVTITLGDDGLPEIKTVNTYSDAIVDFADVKNLYRNQAGRKLARLSIMHDRGIAVPRGFAIGSEALWEHLKHIGLMPLVQEIDSTSADNSERINALASEIQTMIAQGPFHEDLSSQIEQAIDRYSFGKCAVRSSGDEDDKGKSMAGLFESHVNITEDEVSSCIRQTIASYFAPTAVSAIKDAGRMLSDTTLGVGVQEYITDPQDPNQKGGTVFTYPDQIVIESSGSPEHIVSGTAKDYTRTTVNRAGEIQSIEHIGLQDETDGYLEDLISQAQKIETIFGGYQDIEWVHNKTDGLVILQARPL